MTIKLLTDWPYKRASGAGYVTIPAGAVVTVFDSATEAAMIAGKLAEASSASATWAAPSDAPVYVGLTNEQAAATQALVSPDGIFPGGGAYPAAAPRHAYAQVPVGTFGDSIANISTYGTQDLRQISSGAFASNADRMGVALNALSGGAIRVVFNGGISGETTTQMLARDAAGGSSTRKALTDAVTSGCRYLVFSAGINDFQHSALPAGSSAATIASTVAATVSNVKALLRRAVSLGMVPIFPALLGYRYETVNFGSLPTNNAAAVATTQTALALFNAAIKAEIVAAGGLLGFFEDSGRASVVDSAGAWLAGMDQGDGLHPSWNACRLVYAPVAQRILSQAGLSGASPLCYPDGVNLFSNSDFSASTSGQATGVNAYTQAGTVTLAKSLVEWRGQMWQEVLCTPTVLDGNGNAGVELDLTWTASGISLNDVIGGEVSVYIDDGSGGPPPVFQWMVRTRANTNYADTPNYNPTVNPKVTAKAPIDARISTPPIVSPAATPATALLSVLALTNSLSPFRIRIARPRVVKLASTY